MMRFLGLAGVASVLALLANAVACASGEAAARDDALANAPPPGSVRLGNDDFDPSCCNRRDLDLNRDGKPDAYQFSKVIDDEVVVVRKEIDMNFDGKIDLVRDLSEKGELISEKLDVDFDSRVDVVVFFERGTIVRKEYDTNFDAKVDLWRFFDKGVEIRKEADQNYDGHVDYWEYYEGGKLDRVGFDRNYDGTVDDWLRASDA